MLTFIDNFDKKHNLSEFIIVIPAVSVGNVGQLTVDLFISTLNLTRVGYIRHPNILPVVAPAAKGLTTECELYASNDFKIAVVQIRSTYGRFGSISKFLASLCKSFKCVVILTGSYAYERKNIHLVSEPLYYLTTDAIANTKLPAIPQQWKKLEECVVSPPRTVIAGSGIGDHLYDMCAAENIPALLVVGFVSEGDNRSDAVAMADYLDLWLKCKPSNWTFPSVWDTLFGNAIPQNLF